MKHSVLIWFLFALSTIALAQENAANGWELKKDKRNTGLHTQRGRLKVQTGAQCYAR